MEIKLIITRTKQNNDIFELFSVQPEIKFCFDSQRKIYHLLREERNKRSIHNNGYLLKNIKYFDKNILYVFDFDLGKKVPLLYEEIIINYNPVMGKKKCNKCLYNNKEWCLLKGYKINKNSYYKCLYWMEK